MKKLSHQHLLLLLIPLLLLPLNLSAKVTSPVPVQQAVYNSEPAHEASVSGDELQQDKGTGIQKRVPGLGATLASILDKLTYHTGDSESHIKNLTASIPLLLPDLYKVFVTL